MAPLINSIDLLALGKRVPEPANTRTSPPTRASMSIEGGFLEAWAQGYNVGSLIILILIVFCNYRSGIWLHKLILLEVRPTRTVVRLMANIRSSFSPSGMEHSSSSTTRTTDGTFQPLLPFSSFRIFYTMSSRGSKSGPSCRSGALAYSSSRSFVCSLSGSPRPGPTSRTSTNSRMGPRSTSGHVHGKH